MQVCAVAVWRKNYEHSKKREREKSTLRNARSKQQEPKYSRHFESAAAHASHLLLTHLFLIVLDKSLQMNNW